MLSVNKPTLCYWAKEFNIDPQVSIKRERKHFHFSMKQVALFHHIKRLRHDEKYTIEGAKIKLREAKLI
jgi:DNA-binding transcriptional MerR regulator